MTDRSRPPFEPSRSIVLHSVSMGVFKRAHGRDVRIGEAAAGEDNDIGCGLCRRELGLPAVTGAVETGHAVDAAARVIHETIITLAAERGYVFTHDESVTLATDARRAAAQLASRGMLNL